MASMEEEWLERLARGATTIGVLGLGYVGLPLARAFWQGGLRVVGFDVDPFKVERLNRGESYLLHLGADFASPMVQSGRFEATADVERLAEPDALMICVPTPLDKHLQPDLSFVENSTRDIAKRLRPGQLIVLESTTYPGTTRDVCLPILEESGLRLGRDFMLAFSPEREDPGNRGHTTRTIPKLVGGIDAASGRVADAMYRRAVEKTVLVSSAEVAESAKLLENIFRSVNIALINEMKTVLTDLGIDVWEVVEAAKTKPFGFMPFYPGPGLGGHCIPIDPFYLTYRAREVNRNTRFIELAGEVNHAMPAYVISRVQLALNARKKAVNGSKILVLGLSYKPNIDDARESPSFELIEQLRGLGAAVDYSDPHIPQAPKVRKHDLDMMSVTLDSKSIASYDCVLVSTDHDAFDWALIAERAQLIVDTRNVIRRVTGQLGSNVFLA